MTEAEFQAELNRIRPTLTRFAVLQLRDEQSAEDFDGLFEADGHWAEKPADWGDPAGSFGQGRCFEALELCMRALPSNLSRIFLMREVLEMETGEICKELAISIDNASDYVAPPGAEISEAGCIRAVLEEADCDRHLDVNNVYVNSRNHGFDAFAFIRELPPERVA